LWLTFAPVADITAERFRTSLDMVNWLSIVYFVVSVPVGLLAIWILDTIGLRCAVLLCAWLNMVGSIVRVFSVIDSLSLGSLNYVYLLVGQCLCAGAQPLIIFAPTKLAALWFPEDQRATANMIASMSNPLGMLIVNLLSPTIAPEAKDIPLLFSVGTDPMRQWIFQYRTKKFTETTKISFVLSALTCIGFAVVSQMREQTYAVAILSSLFGLFGFSIYPIAMELNVECSYPILGVLFILLFQNLAVEKKNAPFSTCAVSLGPPMDWSNAILVMAGISTLASCFFIITFHTNYKRISAETSQSFSTNKTEEESIVVTA
ncbi:hypothetical protein E2320_016912, partial [Naja naja]